MTNLCDGCIHAMVRLAEPPIGSEPAETILIHCGKVGAIAPGYVVACKYRALDCPLCAMKEMVTGL